MTSYFENHRRNLIILFVITVLHLVVYSQVYGFRPNNDTDSFIYTIELFRGTGTELHPPRYLNPFYPLLGSTMLSGVSPARSIIILNCIFYVGLILLTYDLVRRVFRRNDAGFYAALLVLTSYAILRYGLTQVQDIGGYFWFLATIYAGWRWWQDSDRRWLVLGGLATAFGILTKESGAMGALFVGILLIARNYKTIKKGLIDFCIFAAAPAITMLVNSVRSHDVAFNSFDWFLFNWKQFAATDYTLFRWFSINASTFNFLWILVMVGLYWVIKNRRALPSDVKIFLVAIIPSSLSYFAWSLFISRTVFVSAWLFIAIAVYGLVILYDKGYRYLASTLLLIAVITPYILQSSIGYTPLFVIIEQKCHYKIGCSIQSFRESRKNFDNFTLYSDKIILK